MQAGSLNIFNSFPIILRDIKEAREHKCQEVNLKNQLGNCVITQYLRRRKLLRIYDKQINGSFRYSEALTIDSWYGDAVVEYVDFFNNGTNFIVVRNLEGSTGTGISQRLIAIWGWNNNKFKITLLEAERYHDQATSSRIQRLSTNINFIQQSNKPIVSLRYKYFSCLKYADLTKEQSFAWENKLEWNPDTFSFYSIVNERDRRDRTVYPVERHIALARLRLLENPIRNLTKADISKVGITSFQRWYD